MTDSSADAVVHFPGGRLNPTDWTTLAGVAADHRGELHLTPRGGVRIRRADGETLGRPGLVAAGLATRIGDDRLPHIIASPMAGRLEGHHDLADLPERLDAELASRVDGSAPGGRLVFGLDAGSGDVLAHSPDLAVVVRGGGDTVGVHVAGRDTSVELALTDAVTVLVDVTVDLLGRVDGVSRMPGSSELYDVVVVSLGVHPLASPVAPIAPSTTSVEVPRVGWIDTNDGLVSLLAVVPDGVVPARLAEFLGAVDRPSTVSADRVIGLHALTEDMAEQVVRVLAPMGMIFDAASPWAFGSA